MFRMLVAVFALASGPAIADLQSCQRLFAATPQILSDLNKGESKNFEDDYPGLGYSVSFVDTATKLTVFFYDYQQKTISPEMGLEHFRQSAQDMRTVTERRGSELGEIKAYQVNEQSQLFRLRAEAETLDGASELLALGVVDNCIVKVRFTARFSMDKAKIWMIVVLEMLNENFG